ncbi:hypothetical protein EXS70_04975 [Candidatus Peribacteria bacterium]|nr:hypothetical protein [Candidatus Peribacteria bacterium]
MSNKRALIVLAFMVPLALSACGSSNKPAETVAANSAQVQQDAGTVTGARNAIAYSLSILRTVVPTVRPGSLLSIYTSQFLADGPAMPVFAAMDGVKAQLRLHALPTEENVDDLYALLEEFAAVLHVDISDLLNRSDERTETLDLYQNGLANITERSTRRSEEIAQQLATAKTTQTEQKKTVSGIDKELKAAVKAKDFSTAQERQKELAAAREELTQTELQSKELTSIQSILKELLDIAGKRITALESNREVLIAGLKVVDVPGVDDLGVIEGKTGPRKKSGHSPFGGL